MAGQESLFEIPPSIEGDDRLALEAIERTIKSDSQFAQQSLDLFYEDPESVEKTDKGVYMSGKENNKLTFTLNGQDVNDVAERVIKSEDVLLINYGRDDDATLKKRYEEIPRDAHEANIQKDPAACSGDHTVSFKERLEKAVVFWE